MKYKKIRYRNGLDMFQGKRRGDMLKELSTIFRGLTSRNLNRSQVINFFKNITNEQVKYIVEIVINLLSGTIPIAEIHRRSLKPYIKLFRNLAMKSISLKRKTNLIKKNIKPILILIKLTQFRLNQLMSDNV